MKGPLLLVLLLAVLVQVPPPEGSQIQEFICIPNKMDSIGTFVTVTVTIAGAAGGGGGVQRGQI